MDTVERGVPNPHDLYYCDGSLLDSSMSLPKDWINLRTYANIGSAKVVDKVEKHQDGAGGPVIDINGKAGNISQMLRCCAEDCGAAQPAYNLSLRSQQHTGNHRSCLANST